MRLSRLDAAGPNNSDVLLRHGASSPEFAFPPVYFFRAEASKAARCVSVRSGSPIRRAVRVLRPAVGGGWSGLFRSFVFSRFSSSRALGIRRADVKFHVPPRLPVHSTVEMYTGTIAARMNSACGCFGPEKRMCVRSTRASVGSGSALCAVDQGFLPFHKASRRAGGLETLLTAAQCGTRVTCTKTGVEPQRTTICSALLCMDGGPICTTRCGAIRAQAGLDWAAPDELDWLRRRRSVECSPRLSSAPPCPAC